MLTMEQYFNVFQKHRISPMQLLANTHKPPSEIVIMIFHRKLCLRDKNERIFKKHEPVLFDSQFPILATERTTRRELYEQVWLRVRSQLKLSCHDRDNLWWNQVASFPQNSLAESSPAPALRPFVLKHVDVLGVSCSICHWSKRCHGCPIEPSTEGADELKQLLLGNTFIACEWDIDFYESNRDT